MTITEQFGKQLDSAVRDQAIAQRKRGDRLVIAHARGGETVGTVASIAKTKRTIRLTPDGADEPVTITWDDIANFNLADEPPQADGNGDEAERPAGEPEDAGDDHQRDPWPNELASDPTLSELLSAALTPRSLNATIEETGVLPAAMGATATDEQKVRALDPPKGLKGKALGVFIITGEGIAPQAKKASSARAARDSTSKGSKRSRAAASTRGDVSEVDQRAAELATEVAASKGAKLSQRVSAVEAKVTRACLLAMAQDQIDGGGWPNIKKGERTPEAILRMGYVPTILGFTSKRAMAAFVDGSTATRDLKDEAKAGAKELTRRIDSHQVWARKAVAAAYGVMLGEEG